MMRVFRYIFYPFHKLYRRFLTIHTATMKIRGHKENPSIRKANRKENKENVEFPGYPVYPESEDIYRHFKKENIDPEDITHQKEPFQPTHTGERNEKDFGDDMSGSDLDVPGSELDDEQEAIGSEDEENNYYSLGGDNHDDLEENRGE
jgi:hypothetical protein